MGKEVSAAGGQAGESQVHRWVHHPVACAWRQRTRGRRWYRRRLLQPPLPLSVAFLPAGLTRRGNGQGRWCPAWQTLAGLGALLL